MLPLFLVSHLCLYLGNSQVSFYRTFGPLVLCSESKGADQFAVICSTCASATTSILFNKVNSTNFILLV